MNTIAACGAALIASVLCATPFKVAAAISGISIPVDSNDALSHPRADGVWSVSVPPAPFDTNTGIGWLINSHVLPPGSALSADDITLHDHVYQSANVPDPSRAVVTFSFDTPTIVKGVEIVQHTNGISKVEGLAGDDLASLISLGAVFGPSGDVVGSAVFSEWSVQVFDLGNVTVAGDFFQLIVRKTSLFDGWANYRMFLLDQHGRRISGATSIVPLAATTWGFGLMLLTLAGRRRHPRVA